MALDQFPHDLTVELGHVRPPLGKEEAVAFDKPHLARKGAENELAVALLQVKLGWPDNPKALAHGLRNDHATGPVDGNSHGIKSTIKDGNIRGCATRTGSG